MKKSMQKGIAILIAVVMLCGIIAPATPVQAKTGNSAGNVITRFEYAGSTCYYGNSIYYSIKNNLYRFNIKTKKSTLVKTFDGFSLSSINVYGGKIYLTVNKFIGTSGFNTYIYSLKTNGTGLKKLAKGRNCHVADNIIYYVQTKVINSEKIDDPNVSNICRMRLDGTGKKKLRSMKDCDSLFVYGSRIYYRAYSNKQYSLCSMKKDGSQNRTELGGSSYSWVGAEEGYLYYSKEIWRRGVGYTYNIYRKKIGAGNSELIVSEVSAASISGSNLYYLNYNGVGTTSSVYKMNMNTKKTSKIASGKGWSNISACGSWIYISKYVNGTSYNYQAVVMTANGNYKKGLQKCFLS